MPPQQFQSSIPCSDGPFDFYVIEYYDWRGKGWLQVAKHILIRCPEGMSGAVKAQQLQREGKIPEKWDRIRIATREEIEEYFQRHPEKNKSVDNGE